MSGTLDTKGAADYLGFSPVTLRQWRCQGRGPKYVKAGRSIRYRVADLDLYQEQHLEQPVLEAPPPRRRKAS